MAQKHIASQRETRSLKPSDPPMPWVACLLLGVLWAVIPTVIVAVTLGSLRGGLVVAAVWTLAAAVLLRRMSKEELQRERPVPLARTSPHWFASWLREIRSRAARRGSTPRCLVALGESDAADRRFWHEVARRAARRRAALRVVLLPLLLAVALVVVSKQFVLAENALWILGVPVVVVCAGVALARVPRSVRGDPLLLVGRVTEGVVYVNPDEINGWPEMVSWIAHGYLRTVPTTVTAACTLRRDGTLVSSPGWRGKHDLGVRRHAYRRIIETERCVLLCTPAGAIIDRITDIERSRSRPRP
jgi:hypothetical protein